MTCGARWGRNLTCSRETHPRYPNAHVAVDPWGSYVPDRHSSETE